MHRHIVRDRIDLVPFPNATDTQIRIAREFQQTIADYQSQAGDLFDLSGSKAAAEALAAELDAFYARIDKGSVKADAANTVLQELARILVPLNFNRSDRFRHDPALTIPPPSRAGRSEQDRRTAR